MKNVLFAINDTEVQILKELNDGSKTVVTSIDIDALENPTQHSDAIKQFVSDIQDISAAPNLSAILNSKEMAITDVNIAEMMGILSAKENGGAYTGVVNHLAGNIVDRSGFTDVSDFAKELNQYDSPLIGLGGLSLMGGGATFLASMPFFPDEKVDPKNFTRVQKGALNIAVGSFFAAAAGFSMMGLGITADYMARPDLEKPLADNHPDSYTVAFDNAADGENVLPDFESLDALPNHSGYLLGTAQRIDDFMRSDIDTSTLDGAVSTRDADLIDLVGLHGNWLQAEEDLAELKEGIPAAGQEGREAALREYYHASRHANRLEIDYGRHILFLAKTDGRLDDVTNYLKDDRANLVQVPAPEAIEAVNPPRPEAMQFQMR